MGMIKKYGELIRYIVIGILTTLVSLVTYYLLTGTIIDPNVSIELQLANVCSWIISVTFAYFANRLFVFKSENKYSFKEIFNFYLSRISTLFIEILFMYYFVTVLDFDDKVFKIIVQIIVILLNYILSKFLVFKKNK